MACERVKPIEVIKSERRSLVRRWVGAGKGKTDRLDMMIILKCV